MPARLINKVLGALGLAMIRKETLQSLVSRPPEAPRCDFEPAIKGLKEAEEERFKELLRHQISVKWDLIDTLRRHRAEPASACCPLCGFQDARGKFSVIVTNCIFGGGELIRHQCPQCDLIFGDEKVLSLSEAELSRDYEWHYKVYCEGDSTEQEVRAFHALNPRKDGVYLNWGAGAWSSSIDVLRRDGWNVFGYEPHGSATQGGEHVITSKAQLLERRFDGIFSNNVLEHLRYPVRELKEMRGLIKVGGRMSHATPCFEYRYEYTRFHLFFYLGRSRAILAQQAGLKIDDYVADGDFMNLVLSPD